MAGKTIAKVEAAVPDLVRPAGPKMDLAPEDISLPRLYVGQYSSKAVKNQKQTGVEGGDIFLANGPDDPEPTVLWKYDVEGNGGVLLHVLGLERRKSYSNQADGIELTSWDFDDPDAHSKAWTTYNYTVCLPETEDGNMVPAKFLLTKTGRQTARTINTEIVTNEAKGPAYCLAFRIFSAFRQNPKGDYWVAMVRREEAVEANIDMAQNLAVQMSGASADIDSTNEDPEI